MWLVVFFNAESERFPFSAAGRRRRFTDQKIWSEDIMKIHHRGDGILILNLALNSLRFNVCFSPLTA